MVGKYNYGIHTTSMESWKYGTIDYISDSGAPCGTDSHGQFWIQTNKAESTK